MLPSAHACLLLLQVDFDCETALQKLGLLLKAAVDNNVSPCHWCQSGCTMTECMHAKSVEAF
jgi:hypothetical protein